MCVVRSDLGGYLLISLKNCLMSMYLNFVYFMLVKDIRKSFKVRNFLNFNIYYNI